MRHLAFASAAAILLLLPSCTAQTAQPNYASNPDFIKQVKQAKAEARSLRTVAFAPGTWKKANKIANGKCAECFEGIADADMQMGEWKDALQAARDWERVGEGSPADTVRAQVLFARIAVASMRNKKPNQPLLEEAHGKLQQAERHATAPYFLDGRVLSLLKRDTEAGEAFARYVKGVPVEDKLRKRAAFFSTHPALAREDMAPAVIVKTLGGKTFNLDDMHGRVVLIDFWAVWCGPCNEELPHIKRLAQKYANDPFELISISWDDDETKWKDFIAKNGMTWNQFRDADHSVTNSFGINAIPHYFTIDANGVLTAENVGSGANIDGRIQKLVEAAKQQAATTPSGLQ